MTGEVLIDTSTVIDFFEGKLAPETKSIMATSELCISAVTYGEIYRHLLKEGKTTLWSIYRSKLDNWKYFTVTKEISEKSAELAHRFGFSFADSLIYATALYRNLPLLTNDNDFRGKKGTIIGKKLNH